MMTEYSKQQQIRIENLLSSLKNKEINYVIPRGYQNLPKSVPGGDIDIIVQGSDYVKAIDICKQHDFSSTSTKTNNIIGLVSRAVGKPSRAAEMIINEPRSVVREVTDTIAATKKNGNQIASRYSEFKAKHNGIMIHISNHVGYKSPYNGQTIRVDPVVEEMIHKRSIRVNSYYIPSPPDELAHLICRGVFDHKGKFPKYYVEWCNELRDEVLSDETYRSQLQNLFKLLFYNAASVVIENVEDGTYNKIKSDLIQFDGY